MWRWRDHRFSGYKFRRQHSVGDYILDLFCEAAELNIELDGILSRSTSSLRGSQWSTLALTPALSPRGEGEPFDRLEVRIARSGIRTAGFQAMRGMRRHFLSSGERIKGEGER
jgi:hypothetical protein